MQVEETLATKISMPVALPNQVVRARLAINFAAERFNSLTLVCAPAGYGKTTLISSCVTVLQAVFAWLSLDADDNLPAHFLANVIAAIAVNVPKFGDAITRLLQSSSALPIAALAPKFLNEIASLPGRMVLFLDDYHVIENPSVHEFVAFMLDHQPNNLHIVIASRTLPSFSVARLRTQGRLHEITEADLRFTVHESEEYFNRVMSLRLSAADVQALRDRTEGWAAGLQLAALSLRASADVSTFINSFSGLDRHVTDFMMDEVLSSLSPQMQSFLFRTSIVERFNAQLCNVLMERDDSAHVLAELERLHLFLVPLDGGRKWYRYHHLFSDLLQGRLAAAEQASGVNLLHAKAATWFKENGFPTEAIAHAMAAKNINLVATIVDQYAMHYFTQGKISTVTDWLKYLPEATILGSPIIALLVAISNFFRVNPDTVMVERYMNAVDQTLRERRKKSKSLEDAQMLVRVMLVRGYQARYVGDIDKALSLFGKVCEGLPKQDPFYTTAKVNLGICNYVTGKIDEANAIFLEYAGIRSDQPNLWITVVGYFGLGRIQYVRGNLHTAKNIFEEGVREFAEHGLAELPICSMFHLGLCELEYQADNLEKAAAHGKRAIDLATAGGMAFLAGCSQVVVAQVKLAQGDKRGLSAQTEQKLLDLWVNNSMVTPSMLAYLSRLWLLQGRAQDLANWYDKRGINSKDLQPGLEMEHLMLARLLLHRQSADKASDLLVRLLTRAEMERDQRTALIIEILILLALARHAMGNLGSAFDTLHQALHLAAVGGYIRVFVDEGLPMLFLLNRIKLEEPLSPYRDRLLSAFSQNASERTSVDAAVVPMTSKEAKIVELIGAGLSHDDIAAKLLVSPQTIKWHLKNIYRKLGVSRWADAVRKIRAKVAD